jgi:hypothetical protein
MLSTLQMVQESPVACTLDRRELACLWKAKEREKSNNKHRKKCQFHVKPREGNSKSNDRSLEMPILEISKGLGLYMKAWESSNLSKLT